MTTIKRIITLMLVCALLTTLGAQTLAETRVVYVGRNGAKVYSPSGSTLASLPRSAKLRLTGIRGSVCQVTYNGQVGYMKKSDLSASQPDAGDRSSYSRTVYAAKNGAKLYNASGVLIGAVPMNTRLTCTGVKGSVCRVTHDGRTAYMKKSDLSNAPVVIPEVTAAPKASRSATAYASRDGATVYGPSGQTLGSLGVNTAVKVTAVRGSACLVNINGKAGVMRRADLSGSKVAVPTPAPAVQVAAATVPGAAQAARTASATAYVRQSGAKVYSTAGRVLAALDVNTEVRVTAVKGSACLVSVDGKTGVMRRADLSAARISAETAPCRTAFVSREGARVYDASGKVLGTLPINTAVTVGAVRGSACLVSVNGKRGLMRRADLACEKVAQPSGVVDIPNTTGYVNRNGAKVYDASGRAIAELPVNTAVTVSAYSDTLVQVVSGSLVGYMAKSDIAPAKVATVDVAAGYTLKRGDSGEAVKKVQQRLKALGYFAGVVGGNYQSLTKAAVEAFQSQAKLSVTGVCDARTLEALFSDSAPRMPQTAEYTAGTSAGGTSSRSTVVPARGTAREMDWWTSGIQSIFARGTTAVITDVATGLAWREQRRGGTNHADVQPLTAADTAVLKKVYGGTWSWNRRAIFVTINGVNYAASMNGMPHGGGSISGNNFNGHHCIHFTNSRTHGSNKVCSLHQSAIRKALAVKL